MFAVVSGTIEASRDSMGGKHPIGVHGPGSFTGEVGTLDGRAAVATARAQSDCEVIVIDEESLRALAIAEVELSETITHAYILRRVAYIQDQHGGVLVIGSSASAETHRLRHFLSRNGQPSAYFNIAEHPEARELLARRGATEADMPVVVTLQGMVLQRPTHRAVADTIGLSPDRLNGERFDVVVVGAGPAGLAAAVYAASEGERSASARAGDLRGVKQKHRALFSPENGRAVSSPIRANAFEDAHPIVKRGYVNMDLRVAPISQSAVHPDLAVSVVNCCYRRFVAHGFHHVGSPLPSRYSPPLVMKVRCSWPALNFPDIAAPSQSSDALIHSSDCGPIGWNSC